MNAPQPQANSLLALNRAIDSWKRLDSALAAKKTAQTPEMQRFLLECIRKFAKDNSHAIQAYADAADLDLAEAANVVELFVAKGVEV